MLTPQTYALDRNSVISRAITLVRWPLAFLVVADHYFRPVYTGGSTEAFDWIYVFIVSFFKNYSVPVFFFISGYLAYFGSRFTWDGYKAKWRKMPRQIIIPYIIWCLIGALILLATAPYYTLPTTLKGWIKFPLHIFGLYDWFPSNIPLWYMRDYLVVYCTIPLMHKLLQLSKGWILLLFGVLFAFTFNDNSACRLQMGLLFFYFGYWMRISHADVMRAFSRLAPWCAVIYVGGALSHMLYFDIALDDEHITPLALQLCKDCAIIAFVPLIIWAAGKCTALHYNAKHMAMLASASFFVYVVHGPLHTVVMQTANLLRGGKGGVAVALACIITPLLLTLIYIGLKRVAPRAMKIIDGR